MKRISGLVLWSLLLYLVLLSQAAQAQRGEEGPVSAGLMPTLHFAHLIVDNGLVQNSIEAILQDRRGFIWIGTRRPG